MLVATAFFSGVMIFAVWEAWLTIRHDGGLDLKEVVRTVQSLKGEVESRAQTSKLPPEEQPTLQVTLPTAAIGSQDVIPTDQVATPRRQDATGNGKVFETAEEFFGHLTGGS